MNSGFEAWLLAGEYDAVAAKSRVSNLRRIELAYGDLDSLYSHDRFRALLEDLTYGTADATRSAPNPSRIEIDGDLRTGLATLRSAVNKYTHFKQQAGRTPSAGQTQEPT